MSVTDWDHFTAWEEDVLTAFHKLQRKVGNEMGISPAQAALQALMGGTNSVLDFVAGTSDKSYLDRTEDRLLAFAVPEMWLKERYGTARPTRQMIMERPLPALKTLAPQTAVYFAVWAAADDDSPTWWYFYGKSGE